MDDGQEANCDAERELLLRDVEDAFEHAKRGRATETEWSLLAWQLGIRDHYKRISTKEKSYA